MIIRNASGVWQGNLTEGKGIVKLGSGKFQGPYSFASRFESGEDTNPEELLGAAHASCFSMALAHELAQAGFTPTRISTTANVTLSKVGEGFEITAIELDTEAEVPNIDNETFLKYAEVTKKNCPVSKALAVKEVTLKAFLKK